MTVEPARPIAAVVSTTDASLWFGFIGYSPRFYVSEYAKAIPRPLWLPPSSHSPKTSWVWHHRQEVPFASNPPRFRDQCRGHSGGNRSQIFWCVLCPCDSG